MHAHHYNTIGNAYGYVLRPNKKRGTTAPHSHSTTAVLQNNEYIIKLHARRRSSVSVAHVPQTPSPEFKINLREKSDRPPSPVSSASGSVDPRAEARRRDERGLPPPDISEDAPLHARVRDVIFTYYNTYYFLGSAPRCRRLLPVVLVCVVFIRSISICWLMVVAALRCAAAPCGCALCVIIIWTMA